VIKVTESEVHLCTIWDWLTLLAVSSVVTVLLSHTDMHAVLCYVLLPALTNTSLLPPCPAGNESPVTAYMKSAGLMFENRESFGALVIFIEVGGGGQALNSLRLLQHSVQVLNHLGG
jgi:hypothetical protein